MRRLSDYLDGELDARTEKEVSRHLKECIRCLASYRSLRWSVTALRRYPSVPIPLRVRQRVRRHIFKAVGKVSEEGRGREIRSGRG